MPSATLCVVFSEAGYNDSQFGIEEDAERPGRHSHAEHGNEYMYKLQIDTRRGNSLSGVIGSIVICLQKSRMRQSSKDDCFHLLT
jgi:hypothetical protein